MSTINILKNICNIALSAFFLLNTPSAIADDNPEREHLTALVRQSITNIN